MLSWILLMMLSHENRRRIGQYPWQIGDKHVHTWLCELETPLDGHAQEVLECEKVAKNLSKAVLRAVCILADSGFSLNFLYQGGVKSTVSWVFEDIKSKISEGYDQNWCFPDCPASCLSLAGSGPSEILNLRSSNTQETIQGPPSGFDIK